MSQTADVKTLLTQKLHTLIKEGDEVDRCYAVRCLSTVQHVESTDLLLNALHDDDIDVCIDAANALGELGPNMPAQTGATAAGMLIESLKNDPDGDVKTACLTALAQLQTDDALPYLLKIAEQRPDDIEFDTSEWDVWWDMQMESIKALGEKKIAEAVPVFKRILDEDDCLDVENELFNALCQIGERGADTEAGSANALLLELLENGSARHRRRVASALARSQSRETMVPLARALKDTDADVRVAALSSLNRRHAHSFMGVVLILLKDKDATVRQAAIETAHGLIPYLKDATESSAIETLVEKLKPLLHDADAIVQTTAIEALNELDWQTDQQTNDHIIALLSQSTGDCFAAACRYISTQQLDEAIPDLLTLFRRQDTSTEFSQEEKIHALTAIGQLKVWNSKVEALLAKSIYDDKKTVRLNALEALAQLDQHFPEASRTNLDQADTQQLPIDLISQALQGTLEAPVSLQAIPVKISEVQSTADSSAESPEKGASLEEESSTQQDSLESSNETATISEVPNQEVTTKDGLSIPDQQDDETNAFVKDAMDEISKSIADGEKPHPLSTLDSMMISHVEGQLQEQAKQNAPPEEIESPFNQAEVEEELQEFLALSKNNAKTAEWLFNKNPAKVSIDIQHLAARILGDASSSIAIEALLEVFDGSDDTLQREAILSIGRYLEKTPATLPLAERINQVLVRSLGSEDRDLRIAAARVLGQLGSEQHIAALQDKLDDENVAMRIHTLRALSQLALRSDNPELDISALIEKMLTLLQGNEPGIHRAVVDSVVPLFEKSHNAEIPDQNTLDQANSLKSDAISHLIDAGLAGTHGQVREMSWGLNALDNTVASQRLLDRIEELETSTERRYIVEMLGELHRPASASLN